MAVRRLLLLLAACGGTSAPIDGGLDASTIQPQPPFNFHCVGYVYEKDGGANRYELDVCAGDAGEAKSRRDMRLTLDGGQARSGACVTDAGGC